VNSAFKKHPQGMMLWSILKRAGGQKAVEGTGNFILFPDYVEVAFKDVRRGGEPPTLMSYC